MPCKQIDHHAVVARVEVLHDDEGHAVGRRQRVQKFPARVKAASRSADCDNRKLCRLAGRERLGYPARSPPLDNVLEASWHFAIFLEKQRSGGTYTKQYQNLRAIAIYFDSMRACGIIERKPTA